MRFILFILLCCSHCLYAQQLIPEKTIQNPASFFTTDNLGNIYFVKEQSIQKHWANGNTENKYSDKVLGDITHIDASNPMRVLVFYRNTTNVVFLDNTLSRHSVIELEQYGLEQAILACTSNNNGFWVYDQLSFQLVRLDQGMNVVQETGNLSQALRMQIQPNCLLEANNRIYLNDPGKGILVFDIFGTYLKTIPIKKLDSFQVSGEHLYYTQDNQLYRFDMKLLSETTLELPVEARQVRVEKKKVYALTKKGVSIFNLSE